MKFYINEHDIEELPRWVEAADYDEARKELNKLIGIISEEDLESDCIFCNRTHKTTKGSANEGICINCRDVYIRNKEVK